MADRRASLTEPRIEALMHEVDSKFTLVTLSAMRAREINDYYNQLGEGLGRIVPPQVTSVSRKPLSIALEEVAAAKIQFERIDPLPVDGADEPAADAPAPDASAEANGWNDGTHAMNVVLGVSGGIAAYKAVEVCRRLVDAGVHVAPVLTEDATRFVGAVTFSALASEPARTSLFDGPDPIPHTTLGQGADLIVVAPATAKLLGKYAAGISDDLLTATLLATRAPVLVCPAMHTEMWEHPAVQENLATLRRRGVHVLEPEAGRLAGGDVGAGRLAAPERIAAAALALLDPAARALGGVRVLVTAGGTREPIDAVRVITNRSSGKQGYAIAAAAARRGAHVTLVTTVHRAVPPGLTEVVAVETAAEMETAVTSRAGGQDVIVMAAAVADFRPKAPSDRKTKKEDGPPEIVLEPTHDFLVDLGAAKPAGQVLVGFAAETDDLVAHAADKLRRKRLDLIVGNDVGVADSGFEVDTNRAVLLDADGGVEHLPLMTKDALAEVIVDRIVTLHSSAPGRASYDSPPGPEH